METVKFKMTFKNSWWQCLVAIFLFKPIGMITTIVIISAFSGVGLTGEIGQDIEDISNIIAIILVLWLARYLSKKTWERKQKKLAALSNTQNN
ncbi:MAG: hypothetical protein AAB455_02765 [Patescibacteria group bacterium]